MAPRYFQTVTIRRPTVGDYGDVSLATAATGVKAAIWDRRLKAVIGGQGELVEVTAIGFFPPGTDLRYRDRIILHGRQLEVLQVVSGYDDRGVMDHVGGELRDV